MSILWTVTPSFDHLWILRFFFCFNFSFILYTYIKQSARRFEPRIVVVTLLLLLLLLLWLLLLMFTVHCLVNPLTPGRDQHKTSPYNIHTFFSKQRLDGRIKNQILGVKGLKKHFNLYTGSSNTGEYWLSWILDKQNCAILVVQRGKFNLFSIFFFSDSTFALHSFFLFRQAESFLLVLNK